MEKELDFDIEDDFPIYNIADYPSDTSNKTTNKTTNEVDEIIEFYRDLEENAKEEEQQQPASSQKIKKRLSYLQFLRKTKKNLKAIYKPRYTDCQPKAECLSID